MLCRECQRQEANVHIIKIVDGKKTELYLCERCACTTEELDFSFEPQFSLHKLFSSLLEQSLLGSRKALPSGKTQCSGCGLTFAQFSQVGRFGCSECIAAFEEKLRPLLRRIHASCSHTGKVPLRDQKRVKFLRELEQLKEILNCKIQDEEFEEAALLRDQIRVKEKEIQEERAANLAQET